MINRKYEIFITVKWIRNNKNRNLLQKNKNSKNIKTIEKGVKYIFV